ncbi:Protein of unknown function [Evansella caseinilytica]|uniref:DUF3231 family protein n=1 Tax=Evansella caseinilytica TaxID=1503961 RepID=A0A1H3Q847_9BACI|nr:DUF3231 family protein [Evansella caseinilytica]SDZ09278.1 Protein of unknown function [Evansella caseinilytica]
MKHHVRLSSAEIGSLWEAYMLNGMSICIMKHFQKYLEDEDIKPILSKALQVAKSRVEEIERIFKAEKFPVPAGYSDQDVNLSAPPLFHQEFSLSFVYAMGRMAMINYAYITSSVARPDVRDFFKRCLQDSVDLFDQSVNLMLEKGIYDRPPMINYPKKVTFIEDSSIFTGYLNEDRPLNTIELSEMFLNIERNYFGTMLCVGFIQTVTDKQIKKFIEKGKEICDKQLKFFNQILVKENLLGTVPTQMLVTDSTVSPFSDRLITQLFTALNKIDITLIGHSLSLSMRSDLAVYLTKLLAEVLKYAQDGFEILVKRKWMEQPPQALRRK